MGKHPRAVFHHLVSCWQSRFFDFYQAWFWWCQIVSTNPQSQGVAKKSPQVAFRGPHGQFWGVILWVFFRLQPKDFSIKKSARNKTFRFTNVLDFEDSHGDHYFSLGARDLLEHDDFWTTFGTFRNQNMKKHSQMIWKAKIIKYYQYWSHEKARASSLSSFHDFMKKSIFRFFIIHF